MAHDWLIGSSNIIYSHGFIIYPLPEQLEQLLDHLMLQQLEGVINYSETITSE